MGATTGGVPATTAEPKRAVSVPEHCPCGPGFRPLARPSLHLRLRLRRGRVLLLLLVLLLVVCHLGCSHCSNYHNCQVVVTVPTTTTAKIPVVIAMWSNSKLTPVIERV